MIARQLDTTAIASAYDGGSVTLRALAALGWGPELLNLGYFRWRGFLNVLNLLPSRTRLLGTQKELVRQLARQLRPKPGACLLEIACGRGYFAYYLASAYPGTVVTAIDLLAENVHVAQTFYGKTRNLSYQVGDAQALAFPSQSFDQLVCLEAAFHFPDRAAFLREAYRVLRPGGRLSVVDFHWREGGRQASAARADGAIVQQTWGFQDFWTAFEYRQAVTAAGFSLVKVCDWTNRVTRPLQGQFNAVAALAATGLGRTLLCRSHPTLRAFNDGDWQALRASALAHQGFQQATRYVCMQLVRP